MHDDIEALELLTASPDALRAPRLWRAAGTDPALRHALELADFAHAALAASLDAERPLCEADGVLAAHRRARTRRALRIVLVVAAVCTLALLAVRGGLALRDLVARLPIHP